MDYKNYSSQKWAVSADADAVGVLMANGKISNYSKPTNSDLLGAAEWLATYQVMDDMELGQSIANVIAFLEMYVESNQKRQILVQAKRKFAKEHGIKVSQVKVKKEAK